MSSPSSDLQAPEGRPTAVPPSPGTSDQASRQVRMGRWKALAVLLVCAAPVIASSLTYYVFQPEGRTNYGELIAQRPIGELQGVTPEGRTQTLGELGGRWLMVMTAPGACDPACEHRLYISRQVRTTTGKDMDRVDRVLLEVAEGAPSAEVLAQHPGLHRLRVDPVQLGERLGMSAAEAEARILIVDPLGHLMMSFPPDADPNRMKKDLARLLRASRVG